MHTDDGAVKCNAGLEAGPQGTSECRWKSDANSYCCCCCCYAVCLSLVGLILSGKHFARKTWAKQLISRTQKPFFLRFFCPGLTVFGLGFTETEGWAVRPSVPPSLWPYECLWVCICVCVFTSLYVCCGLLWKNFNWQLLCALYGHKNSYTSSSLAFQPAAADAVSPSIYNGISWSCYQCPSSNITVLSVTCCCYCHPE